MTLGKWILKWNSWPLVGKQQLDWSPAAGAKGLEWSHHHRVFWMFHETHHLYESLGSLDSSYLNNLQHALDDRQYCKRIPKNCSWSIYGIFVILFRMAYFAVNGIIISLDLLYLSPCQNPGREGSYQTALSESKRLGSSSQVRPKQRAASVLFAAKGGRSSFLKI